MDAVYDRATLLGKLKLVQPALAKPAAAAIASIFENVWLTDYGLMASNDVIAIATPLDATPVIGGVHGGKLIGLINNCDCEIVRMGNGDGSNLLVHGGFNAKLAVDHGDPPFTWAQPQDGTQPMLIDKAAAASLKLAAAIADPASTSTQARGITVDRTEVGTLFFASDRVSVLRVEYPATGSRKTAILSLPFVEQMVRLAPGSLWLQDGYALFEGENAGLWGRLLSDRTPLDYGGVMEQWLPKDVVPLPDGFDKAIARAGLMAAPDATKKVPVRLTIADGSIQISAGSAYGEVSDTLPMGALMFDHPSVSLHFDYKLVARVLDKGFTHLGATNKALLFSGDGLSYMIATHD